MSKLAEVFSPGEFLSEELEARGWTQVELAEIMGRPTTLISAIVKGKKQITPDTAIQLGSALGTDPELWMNLDSQYQLSKIRYVNDNVSRKSRLYEQFPVREMIKRGWINATDNIEILEQQFLQFFNISDIDAKPVFCHAAKKSNPQEGISYKQLAWLFRAKSLAASQITKKFDLGELRNALPNLSALLSAPEEARHVAKILNNCGVKYVVVEPFPGSKIDGACFWLDNEQPVIALTLRMDRIDNFWFVLRHEIEHVLQGHGKERGFILDSDAELSCQENVDEDEIIANEAAANFCVPKVELDSFYARVFPLFSEQKIKNFSSRLNIHPGLVVGQLQRKLNRFDFLRAHQVKIRTYATFGTLTDGWGNLSSN
jgi:HTH-type transcriptional regulator / antitoxin HigA